MEGSYNKVLSAKQDGLYAQEGMYFMDMLVDTVREEIAECSEKAYSSIAAADLQSLLMLASEAELGNYAENARARHRHPPAAFTNATHSQHRKTQRTDRATQPPTRSPARPPTCLPPHPPPLPHCVSRSGAGRSQEVL